MTELGTIAKPGVLVATDALPGYRRGKADKRAPRPRAVDLDLSGWPEAVVYRIDTGVVLARFTKRATAPLTSLAGPIRDVVLSSALRKIGTLDALSGALALLPPKQKLATELGARLARAAMTTVNGAALLLCIMGAGDVHGAAAVPGGIALAAAPTAYDVWEDATPVDGPFGRIDRRVVITFDELE